MTTYVHAIWCDDIRMELGNKPSFMGVYTGGIVVPALPTVLPKLCVYAWVVSPIESPASISCIRVVRDDGSLVAEVKPEHPTASLGADPSPQREGATRKVVMAGLGLGSVEFPANCRYLTLMVDTAAGSLEGPKLHVDVNPSLTARVVEGE